MRPPRSTATTAPASAPGQRRRLPALLVPIEHRDALEMTWVLRERGVDEGGDDRRGLVEGVHASADRHDLGVVVLPRQGRGLDAPREGGTNSGDLVRSHLLAVPGATDDHTEAALVGHHADAGLDAVG